ncbi:MAG: cyclopropane-fatty-acyl-phospholipid synthase family protein [Dokdonella sp.]|nr:cyclopropane-fatty-acyl-phospholipid synthase family protein [Dokdonella sp.]
MNAPASALPPASTAPLGIDRWLRRRLFERLAPLTGGRLTVHDPCGRQVFGTPGDLDIAVRVKDLRFYRALAANGSVGAGEAYIDGLWQCDDLVGLVRLLVRNRALLDGLEGGAARVGGWALRAWHALRPNTRAGSRRNIAAHYDLGNDFFALFLSQDLMYSSALFTHEAEDLELASWRKLDLIGRTLALAPGDRVIEIGSGWGGFALHAARRYGCHVTTTTISRAQFDEVRRRVAAAGLEDRVTVLAEDYRDLTGQYDKLVSIEMIEAIGARHLDTYFATLQRLLVPGGRALLQAITIEDHRYEQALRSVDFIKRFVFPGSFIPSISAMLSAKTRASDLQVLALQDFGQSYARTLHAWRTRFMTRLNEVRALGYDERFIRLWEFYLAYCEGGFRERSIGVAHLLLGRPGADGGAARAAP